MLQMQISHAKLWAVTPASEVNTFGAERKTT